MSREALPNGGGHGPAATASVILPVAVAAGEGPIGWSVGSRVPDRLAHVLGPEGFGFEVFDQVLRHVRVLRVGLT